MHTKANRFLQSSRFLAFYNSLNVNSVNVIINVFSSLKCISFKILRSPGPLGQKVNKMILDANFRKCKNNRVEVTTVWIGKKISNTFLVCLCHVYSNNWFSCLFWKFHTVKGGNLKTWKNVKSAFNSW